MSVERVTVQAESNAFQVFDNALLEQGHGVCAERAGGNVPQKSEVRRELGRPKRSLRTRCCCLPPKTKESWAPLASVLAKPASGRRKVHAKFQRLPPTLAPGCLSIPSSALDHSSLAGSALSRARLLITADVGGAEDSSRSKSRWEQQLKLLDDSLAVAPLLRSAMEHQSQA